MNFKVSQLGDIAADANRVQADFAKAAFAATKAEGVAAQAAHRQAILSSGIRRANVVAKTWRVVMRPTQPAPGELRLAAIVFNRSKVFTRFFAEEGVARAKNGGALVVPIGRAAKLKLPPGKSRSDLLALARATFGELTAVKIKGGRLALALVTPRAGGKAKVEPMFLLLKEVRRRVIVDPDRIQDAFDRGTETRWQQKLGEEFTRLQGASR